jgi:hypothetical protein
MKGVLVLVLFAAACTGNGWQAPPCPTGGMDHGDWATCGPCTGTLHAQDNCAAGYICTCSGLCAAFEHFYPDAAVGCGFVDGGMPSDAGWQAPACMRDGGMDLGSYAICGSCTGALHEQDNCPNGYICTCSGLCAAFEYFGPDGAVGCGLDAGTRD